MENQFGQSAIDGNLLKYNDVIKLGPLFGTSEGTKEGTEGVLDGDADCILLGVELGIVDGDISGSDDDLSLVPSLGLLLGT